MYELKNRKKKEKKHTIYYFSIKTKIEFDFDDN